MPKPDKLSAPRPGPSPRALSTQVSGNIESIGAARELFWQNVIREMLTSLSVLWASKDKNKPAAMEPTGHVTGGDLFDGRVAVITTLGQRIPIGAVYPLFACGIQTTDADRALSMAVECSVFQIHTPGGEVFTVPLHEIRAFHSLSEHLIDEIKQASVDHGGEDQQEPFGFAAYTSLARTNLPGEIVTPPPGLETQEGA